MVEPRERTIHWEPRPYVPIDELENLGNSVYFESQLKYIKNLVCFKDEDELILSQFFMTLSIKEKYEIFEKVANASIRGEIPSMAFKNEIKKKYEERKEKNMLFTNTTANANTASSGVCLQSGCTNTTTSWLANQLNEKNMHPNTDYAKACASSCFGYGAKNFETPIVNGFQLGPNDDVYLFINDSKCRIYPKDETAKREVAIVRNLDIQEFMKAYQEKHGKRIPGGKLKRLQKALIKWRHMLAPFSTKQFNGPSFDRILFHGRATVLLSDKNDKTVVKCMDGEHYDPEKALLTALFIREYGKNAYHDLMDICHETYVECGEPNKPKSKKKTAKKAVSKTKNG